MINEILRNVVYYVEAFFRRPLWVVLPAFLTLAVGVAVIFSLPRSYQSEARLLIEAHQSPTSLVPSTVANEHMQFVEQRVLARDKLLALANKLDLFPGVRETMSETKLAELMRRHIAIQTFAAEPSDRYSGTTAMRIGVTLSSAEQAAAVAAELVNMIIEENRSLRVQRASELSAFLSREVDDMAGKMKGRETAWQAFFEENSMAMPERVQSLDSELQEKVRELAELDQSVSTLDQELRLMEAEYRLGTQRPEGAARSRTQLAELEAELATKTLVYSDAHPEVRALVQRIEGIQQKISTETVSASPSGPLNLTPELALIAERIDIAKARQDSAVARRAEINARIAWLRETTARAPGVQAQVEAIERERETLQGNLDQMKGRLATASVGERLERDGSTAHVQILEAPETPRYPSSPSRTRLLLVIAACAMAAGAAGLYLGDSLQRTIRGTFDLKTPLAGSTLVVVPHWYPDEKRKPLADASLDRLAGILDVDRPATT